MSFSRILQDAPATITEQFARDGVAVDPGAVTIKIDREDGTNLVPALTATTPLTGTDPRTYALTEANTTLLDRLKVTWTSPTEGDRISYVEVCGGFLFTLAEARAVSPLSNTSTYTTAELIAGRTVAEMALEDALGVPLVPRYFREVVDGTGTTDILLSPRPLTITSATVGETSSSAGTALTADELEDLRLYNDGRVYHSAGWTAGRGNWNIKGTHGYRFPPGNAGHACLKLAKWILVDSPVNDRAINMITDEGSQFFVTAGVRNAVFSIPECNALIDAYGVNASVA